MMVKQMIIKGTYNKLAKKLKIISKNNVKK